MVIVNDDGDPMDDWQRRIGRQLSEYLAPFIAATVAPIATQAAKQLAPAIDLVNEQIANAIVPALEPIARRITDDFFTPELLALLEQVRQKLPENWPTDVDLDGITTVIQDEGIPLVWVPLAAVVSQVLSAPNREARVGVLLAHINELVPDCRRVLADVHTRHLSRQLPLASRALDALEQGHHEAAQALAVVVTDAALVGWIVGKFEVVEKTVHFDPEKVSINDVRLQAAVAPLRNFKQRYFAGETPRPPGLNRQVTVHYADAEHFTRGNALVACLLMTSVLRAFQDFEDTHEESQA